MIWTPAAVAEMYALLDQGLSWAAVGERMGCSKGCIAGKVKRLGDRPRPPPVVVAPPPPRLPSPRSCQWIEGDDPRAWVFCGRPAYRSSPYCSSHFQRCYQRYGAAHRSDLVAA